ncbi:hypothetical protein IWQ56_001028 [Coemansia nantahalensis]|nr:hypothetical protein IWQ56_001028 [Coemansia nantahalensis]
MMNTGAAQQAQAQAQQAFSPLSPGMSHPQLVRFRHSCEHCRKRKIKCSGTRPICDHCKRRGIECIYKPQAKSSRRPGSGTSSPLIGSSGSRPPSGLRRPPPQGFGGAMQPISIPAAHSYLQVPLAVSPLHTPDPRYASAPVHTASPLIHAAYGLHTAPHTGSSLRTASALPPHMSAEAGGSKDDMFASLLGYSPVDSFGSAYGDSLEGSWLHDGSFKASATSLTPRPATADPAAAAMFDAAHHSYQPGGAQFLSPPFAEPQTAPARQTAFTFAAPPSLAHGADPRPQRALTSVSPTGRGPHAPQQMADHPMLGAAPAVPPDGIPGMHPHSFHLASPMPTYDSGAAGGFPGAGLVRPDAASSLAKAGMDESAYLDLISSMGAIPHGFGDLDPDDANGAFGAFVDVDGGGDHGPPAAMEVDPEIAMPGDALAAGRAIAKSAAASTFANARRS